MPSAVEECRELSGNRQRISHCLESGRPDFSQLGLSCIVMFLLSLLLLAASEAYIIGDKCLSGCRLTFLYSFL